MSIDTHHTPELGGFVLEREGCPIHYWVSGPEGRPLVVLTHGACVDHHSFDPIAPVIAQKYRVLTWDVRGHGLSQPMGRTFSIPQAVEDLLAIMDRLGYGKAALVGHSNGTYISQEMAFRYPERVSALVVADGTCITWKRSVFERWIVKSSNDVMALMPYEMLKTAGLPFFSAKKEVQNYTYAAFSMLTKKDYLNIWRGATECLHSEPGYHIPQPMLLVHGDQDRTGDIRKIAPRWAAETPNCQYAVIVNASHFAILDQPEKFNELVMDFLGKTIG
jgi:3-oxoadipate enol-lactonase